MPVIVVIEIGKNSARRAGDSAVTRVGNAQAVGSWIKRQRHDARVTQIKEVAKVSRGFAVRRDD